MPQNGVGTLDKAPPWVLDEILIVRFPETINGLGSPQHCFGLVDVMQDEVGRLRQECTAKAWAVQVLNRLARSFNILIRFASIGVADEKVKNFFLEGRLTARRTSKTQAQSRR